MLGRKERGWQRFWWMLLEKGLLGLPLAIVVAYFSWRADRAKSDDLARSDEARSAETRRADRARALDAQVLELTRRRADAITDTLASLAKRFDAADDVAIQANENFERHKSDCAAKRGTHSDDALRLCMGRYLQTLGENSKIIIRHPRTFLAEFPKAVWVEPRFRGALADYMNKTGAYELASRYYETCITNALNREVNSPCEVELRSARDSALAAAQALGAAFDAYVERTLASTVGAALPEYAPGTGAIDPALRVQAPTDAGDGG